MLQLVLTVSPGIASGLFYARNPVLAGRISSDLFVWTRTDLLGCMRFS